MGISRSNIDQFAKIRNFLKSDFCGLHKKDQKFFQCALEAKKLQKQKEPKVLVDTLPVCPFSEKLWTKLHYKTALIWFVMFHDNGSGQYYLPNNLLTLT